MRRYERGYGERLPIGTMEVVDNFPHQALIDYYHTWYRPDQQAIIVVGVEAQGAGPVVEYQQAAVLYRCAGNRYVRYVVYGFIEAGVCVQVVPEFDPDGLKIVDDSLSGEIFRAFVWNVEDGI